jgi:hypothetical protein
MRDMWEQARGNAASFRQQSLASLRNRRNMLNAPWFRLISAAQIERMLRHPGLQDHWIGHRCGGFVIAVKCESNQ